MADSSLLENKLPLKFTFRRKSCHCTWCGGIAPLQLETEKNPWINLYEEWENFQNFQTQQREKVKQEKIRILFKKSATDLESSIDERTPLFQRRTPKSMTTFKGGKKRKTIVINTAKKSSFVGGNGIPEIPEENLEIWKNRKSKRLQTCVEQDELSQKTRLRQLLQLQNQTPSQEDRKDSKKSKTVIPSISKTLPNEKDDEALRKNSDNKNASNSSQPQNVLRKESQFSGKGKVQANSPQEQGKNIPRAWNKSRPSPLLQESQQLHEAIPLRTNKSSRSVKLRKSKKEFNHTIDSANLKAQNRKIEEAKTLGQAKSKYEIKLQKIISSSSLERKARKLTERGIATTTNLEWRYPQTINTENSFERSSSRIGFEGLRQKNDQILKTYTGDTRSFFGQKGSLMEIEQQKQPETQKGLPAISSKELRLETRDSQASRTSQIQNAYRRRNIKW